MARMCAVRIRSNMDTLMKAYRELGLKEGASLEEVKSAYHRLVKGCHPDLFQDPEEQDEAQKRMVRLNLAYEQAIAQSSKPMLGFHKAPLKQAKATARRLLEQGQLESALLQLGRADLKDAEWYALQGEILMGFREYETAHSSLREAVRLDPDNMEFRRLALDAAVQVKKHKQFPMRLKDSIQGLFIGGRKRK